MGTFDKLRARYVEGASGDLTLAAALLANGLVQGEPRFMALKVEDAVRAAAEIFPEVDESRMRQIVDVIRDTVPVAAG